MKVPYIENFEILVRKLDAQIKDSETLEGINKGLVTEDEGLLVYLAENYSHENQDLLRYLTSWEHNKTRVQKRRREED